jgi:hypothetical protein
LELDVWGVKEMHDLMDYVHAANVRRFLHALTTDIDPVQRATMQQLLVEEVNKLGKTIEQLDNASRWIEEGKKRIEIIERTASRFDGNSEHRRRAEQLLSTMQHTQALLEQFHDRLTSELNRIDL